MKQLNLINTGLTVSERFYWFKHNLLRLPIVLLEQPVRLIYNIFSAIYITFFITDGSETIDFPWR